MYVPEYMEVCVCVWEWERERERERDGGGERNLDNQIEAFINSKPDLANHEKKILWKISASILLRKQYLLKLKLFTKKMTSGLYNPVKFDIP